MLRDAEKAKNPALKRSSKELSAIDNMATVADMLVLEARDLKFMRGGDNNIAGDISMIKALNEKYPDVYKFLSDMYNVIINPNTDAEKKVADKDGYVEMSLDHTLRALESLR
jgi:hypothetical protein